MNSAIQCLSNIPELKYYLLFPFLKGNVKESISESFAELIKLLWQDSVMSSTISPHSLKVNTFNFNTYIHIYYVACFFFFCCFFSSFLKTL
jgi:hypothetical protein